MINFLAHSDWIIYNSRKEIASGLMKLNYKVRAVTTIEEYSAKLEEYFDSFSEWDVDRNKLIDIKGIANLRKILKNFSAEDTIHIFSLKSGLYYLFASHFLSKKYKIVLSITGLGYLFSKSNKSKILRNLLRPYMKFFFNRKIDVIIFQNEVDEEILTNYIGYKRKKVLIKGSGVNTKNFLLKEQLKKDSDALKIIMCCRLLKDKGIKEYLKLSSLFDDKHYEFYLAGNVDLGNPASYSETEINQLVEKHNVKYLGWLETSSELKNFDISICMSYHEGLPRIVLESLYVGLYTLSNKLPGLRTIFEQNDYGELISQNSLSEFKKYITNFKEIQNHKEKVAFSRDKIESNFSTNKILKEFVEVYELL